MSLTNLSTEKPDLLKQVPTPLDVQSREYLHRRLGVGFTSLQLLTLLQREPHNTELVGHALQYASSTMLNPLRSLNLETLLRQWDGLSDAERCEGLGRLAELQ